MNPHDPSQSENYEQVIEIARRSMVILVAINTPYLMEYDGRYRDRAGVEEIEQVLKTSLQGDDTDKLILLVPIKCERYTRSREENRRMHDKVKEVFDGTLGLIQNPVYSGRLALALLPVHTVGNAQFSRFDISGGRITREVYLKNRSSRFSPKDADQPLRFAMSFLLNEFAIGHSSLLHDIFSQDDLREVGNFIRSGMKADDPNFEIFCGRNLIEDGAVRRSRNSPRPVAPEPAKEDIEELDDEYGDMEDPSFLPSSPLNPSHPIAEPMPSAKATRRRPAAPVARQRRRTFQAPEPQPSPAGRRPWGMAVLGVLLLAAAAACFFMFNIQGAVMWGTICAGVIGALLLLIGIFGGRRRELTPEELMARDYKRALDWKRDQDWKWLKSVRAFDNLADIFESFGRYRDAAFLAEECRASAQALRVRQKSSLCALVVLAAGGAAVYALARHLDILPERLTTVLDAYNIHHMWVAAAAAVLVFLIAMAVWRRGNVRARNIRRGDE
jgi:hypothetical protein